MPITVLLADDHQVVRDGLNAVLEQVPEFSVVASVGGGREALRECRRHRPRVAVVDISMPGLNGIDLTGIISREIPDVRVICLSMHTETTFVRACMRAGAAGYLAKGCAASEVVQAIRSVAAGGSYLSPRIAQVVLGSCIDGQVQGSAFTHLTEREREVSQMLVEGRSVTQVAEELSVSVSTVHTHRQNIFAKLGVNNAVELVRYALREGLTSL